MEKTVSKQAQKIGAALKYALAYVERDAAKAVASLDASMIEETWRVWLPAIAPKTFTAPFESFHAEFLDWYWALLSLRAGSETVPENLPLAGLLALGRGLGKSTILEAIALAEGAHIPRSFGVYISSTQDKAKEHLASIRDLIESSEIAEYYPGLANPRVGKFGNQRGWRAEAVYTDSGFGIVAASLEQGIRGLRDSEIRPTFILLDDIDERDDSPQIKQEKFDTIRFDALPMLAPFGVAIFAQNLIYSGSIMDDTLKRKLDWFHLRHAVGPVNTFQNDLEIEKVDGRPTIIAGTPNWARIDRPVAQDMLNKNGEESFWRECQNKTTPSSEKLVWKGFSETLHVITWEQFAAVFGRRKIPEHWYLYAGYDAGSTGPERHPAVFSVAAVAAENGKLAGDIFIIYEFVAEASETEDNMAKALIEDLAALCTHPKISEAASLVRQSYEPNTPEAAAWRLRSRAGAAMPFRVFHGSHEANSERKTFVMKWGLPIGAGKAGKTEGLSQLHFYLKPERKSHPFKLGLEGKPNIYLVVANDQLLVPRDRFGLARHRWEAANLKWDVKVTTRDVPTKFGDDATDAAKQYLQTFALQARPLTYHEKVHAAMSEPVRDMIEEAQSHGRGLSPEQEMWAVIERDRARKSIKSSVQRFDDFGRLIDR
ncbi:MAG TPA: hypothetical protein VJ810_23620 [Blastocatellia bacterium]|nr:hypothetical protein [Blastocatellia bacterium]